MEPTETQQKKSETKSTNNEGHLEPSMVKAMTCKTPRWGKHQPCLLVPGVVSLGESNSNSIVLIHRVLDDAALAHYLEEACKVTRFLGRSAYGPKPRREVCYTINGHPYRYSTVDHETVRYPKHVLDVIPLFMKKVMERIPDNKYTWLSNGIDIIYSSEFPRGGSVSAHSDKEGEWGLIIIFSLGQSRWLRFKNIRSGELVYNVLMPHNSIVAMSGATFQSTYTHQVDKLANGEHVGVRLSLNVRFERKDPSER